MFSPIVLQAIGSILKRLLTLGAGYLVGAGFWTAAESGTYVEAATTALTVVVLTVGYAVYDKYLKPHIVKFLSKDGK